MNDNEMINKFLEQRCIGYDFTNNKFSRSIFKNIVKMRDDSEVLRYSYVDTDNVTSFVTCSPLMIYSPYIQVHEKNFGGSTDDE